MNTKQTAFLTKITSLLFFFLWLILGLCICDDYGISWDDQTEYYNGLVNVDYINQSFGNFLNLDAPLDPKKRTISEFKDREYGSWFQVGCYFVQHSLGLEDVSYTYFIRHLCTFLLFWLATIFFYRLLLLRFSNTWVALLGTLILILSPRIFAHSFFNTKDLVFLSTLLIATYFAISLLIKPNPTRAFLAGLTCALAVDVRITGIGLVILTLVFLIYQSATISNTSFEQTVFSKVKDKTLNLLPTLLTYLFALICFGILFWPTLWENPLHNFLDAFEKMSHHIWDGSVRYFNNKIKAQELPWHYGLGWIFVTTPIVYLLFFLTGIGQILYTTINNIRRTTWKLFQNVEEMTDLAMLGLFVGPIAGVAILHSTLYDGWRQLYFVYPPLVYILTKGLLGFFNFIRHKFTPSTAQRFTLAGKGIFGGYLLYIMLNMIQTHPHQYAFFNPAAGTPADVRFEVDYWGMSCRESLEYILRTDTSSTITVHIHHSLKNTTWGFPPEQRKRFRFSKYLNDAQYYVYFNRSWGKHLKVDFDQAPFNNELFGIRPNGVYVGGVYLIKQDSVKLN